MRKGSDENTEGRALCCNSQHDKKHFVLSPAIRNFRLGQFMVRFR